MRALVHFSAPAFNPRPVNDLSETCHALISVHYGLQGGLHLVRPRSVAFYKNCTNNLESSHIRGGTRRMMLPEPLVKIVLSQVDKSFTSHAAGSADASCSERGRPTLRPSELPPGQAARCGGARTSEGEECYLWLIGRAYTLLTHRKPYDNNPANPRIKELEFILSVFRKWNQYNMTMRVAGEQPSNAERQKWGLSHQLLFDFECMIEGFIGLLADLESRYKKVAVLARKINQVPVSLGSHMSPPHPREPFCECCTTNYAHYSGVLVHRIRSRHFSARFGTRWAGVCALSHYKVETGIGRVQEQREVQKKMTERTKQSRNTQDPDAYEGARDPHKVQKIKFGKRVTPRVTFEAEIPRGASPGAEHSFVHLSPQGARRF